MNDTNKYRVLIGSPVRQLSQILYEFLESLKRQNRISYETDYCFVDDNDSEESRAMLLEFAKQCDGNCHIIESMQEDEESENPYEPTKHNWNFKVVKRVISFKNQIIEYAKEKKYDYLFLIDSDIVLHPQTIDQLISCKKDIVANIFWTSWFDHSRMEPQVWMKDQWQLFDTDHVEEVEKLPEDEIRNRLIEMLRKLRKPGTYEVGGLGACTLISRHALDKGCNFTKIKNISWGGEDRHFCVRAVVLGLELYVDTHFPAYHIYREPCLLDVENYKRSCTQPAARRDREKARLTLSLLIQQGSHSHLRQMLEAVREYITDAVIIDNSGVRANALVYKDVLKGIPIVVVDNNSCLIEDEMKLYKHAWDETIKTNPEWILFLNPDEIMEKRFSKLVSNLINDPIWVCYGCRCHYLWNEEEYREDEYWQPEKTLIPFLVRYYPDVPHVWESDPSKAISRFPRSVINSVAPSNIRMKSYCFSSAKNRKKIFKNMGKEQRDSLLDKNPKLVKWVD